MAEFLMQNKTLAFELSTGSETVYVNSVTVDSDLETAPTITVGNTYTVIWDGTYYECVAKEYTEDGMTLIVLGNLNIAVDTEENTGEPFVYLYYSESLANFKTLETDASHIISLYDGAFSHSGYLFKNVELTCDEDTMLWYCELNGNITPFVKGATYTITINGTDYECVAWDTRQGFSAIGGIVLHEQTLTPFAYTNAFGAYALSSGAPRFSLCADETYTVTWDGVEYVRTGFAFTAADGASCVGVGNELGKGGSNTGEPFVVVYDATNNFIHFVSLDTSESHTVAISFDGKEPFCAVATYDKFLLSEAIEADAYTVSLYGGVKPMMTNIVLYDRNGNAVTHEDIATVSFDTDDGQLATFTLSAISSN